MLKKPLEGEAKPIYKNKKIWTIYLFRQIENVEGTVS
jgi:hypothetical protein